MAAWSIRLVYTSRGECSASLPLKQGRAPFVRTHMAVGQNPVPLVNIKIGGTWVFIRPKLEA